MSKKILSLLLAILCVFTFTVPAIASGTETTPEGKGIDSLSEITEANGTYYLKSNIGSAEALQSTTVSIVFTGTLNGNGKTIYTSVPLFAELGANAKVENLTVEGKITTFSARLGSVANAATGAVTMTNVRSNVDITVTPTTAAELGGVIGHVETVVTLKNCDYSGDITVATSSYHNYLGGLIGLMNNKATAEQQTILTNCDNTGNISGANGNTKMAGGMIGYAKTNVNLTLDTCTNSGEISHVGGGAKVGGLVGVADQTGSVKKFINCSNIGMIKGSMVGGIAGDCRNTIAEGCWNAGTITWNNTANYIGGLFGYVNTACNIENCTNKGNVTNGAADTAGLIGYAATAKISNCVNTGSVTGVKRAAGIVSDLRGGSITDCINTGDMKTTGVSNGDSWAGGIASYVHTAISFSKCANYGKITAQMNGTSAAVFAGGITAIAGANSTYTDCANYGELISPYCAGGITAKGHVVGLIFTRCLNAQAINNSEHAYYGNCGIVGLMGNASQTLTFIDCFSMGGNAVGIYAKSTEAKGTIKYQWTATNTEDTIVTGTDTKDCGEGNEQYWNVFLLCNAPFKTNGSLTATTMSGTYASMKMSAFNFGGDWVLKEQYPELSIVENLLGKDRDNLTTEDVDVFYEGVQPSAEISDTFNLRLIASITGLDRASVGMKVYVIKQGDATVKWDNYSTSTVFTKITADTDTGMKEYSADDMVGDHMAALTVTDIPTEGIYTFVVMPYTTGGETVEGTSYAVIIKDGAVVEQYVYKAATR